MADLRCYLTKSGIAAENNAKQFGTTLKITEMVFDGSYLADELNPENLTEVINPVLTVPCSTSISDDGQTLTFKGSILVEQGGFNVWGIGLKTDSGVLYGYARSKGDKILTADEGATESVRYAVDIITKNSDVIEIKVNQSTVYADLEDVDNAVKAHEAKPDPHPQYLLSSRFLRVMLGKPVHESIAGRTQDDDLIAPAVGQKLYVADYQTAYEIISQADNFIDEATKASNPFQYAGYWGFGNDGADFFTTPNLTLTMHIKSAGVHGNAGETKEAHTEDHAHVTGFAADSSGGDQSIGRLPEKLLLNDGDMLNNFVSMTLPADDERKILVSGNGTANGITVQHVSEEIEEVTITGSHLRKNVFSTVINDFTDSMGTFFDPYIWLPKGEF